MKNYKVTITETLQMKVEVEATSRKAAEMLAERNWQDGDYILDADHFKGVVFNAEPPQREQDYER